MVSPSERSPLIVIADEDADRRPQLRQVLEAECYTVVEADDDDALLGICKRDRPALVLLSDQFPNALILCKQIKTAQQIGKPRVVMMITWYSDELLAQMDEAQVDEFVVTPPNMPVLVRRVRTLLEQQSLAAQVEFQSVILSQLGDAVVAVDNESRVIYWNPEAERAYRLKAEEILGQSVDLAYSVDWGSSETRAAVMKSIAETGSWRGEGVHVLPSGERRAVEVAVRELRDEALLSIGFISVIRDISERKRIEEALREQRELADALRDTAAALTRSLDPQSVMRLILEYLGRVVPNKTANIMLIEGDRVRVGFSRGYSSDEKTMIEGLSFSLHEMFNYQHMLTTGQSYLVADTSKDPNWKTFTTLPWIKSYLGTPIRAYDHVVGFLNIDSDLPNAFTPVHVERLRAFADQAAIAVENAQLYEAIYRDAVEMRALHRATTFLYAPKLFTSDNVAEICEQVVRVVIDEFGKLDCGVLLVDETTGSLKRIARAGEFQVSAAQPLYVDGPGLVPEAIRSGRVVYSADVRQDTRYVASNSRTASELVVPLRTVKGVLGVLDLQSAQEDAFDEHDVRLLELFAERAAAAIENVKLYSEIRRYTEELEERVNERTAELNRVKERVEAILNHSSDAILLVRTNGTIQQTNRSFNKMFDSQPDEAFGKGIEILASPDYEEAIKTALDQVVSNRTPARLEIVARRLNGLVFDADLMLSPIMSPPEQVSSIVCSLRDITPRKRLELELREALQKERELSDLKSRFIARASHEFRTPLAVILSSSDLLKHYGSRMSAEQRDEKLDRLQREVRGIAVMLDDLLTISKGEEVKEFNPELMDFQSVVRGIVQEMSEGMGASHHFTFHYTGNCGSIPLDRKLVQRIVTNLLSNAIKYSPIDSVIAVQVTCEAGGATLVIVDEGLGIPEEDQVRLFEAFHRASNVDHISGTGLGLAIVKQAVELHGGDVRVDSKVGKGTTFTVNLPYLAVKEQLS